MQLTNSREAGAFFLARAIIVAIMFLATPYVFSPIYMQLLQVGGPILMTVGTLSISFLAYLLTLALFLVFRGGFGGVPPRVAGYGRRDAVTSSAGEIGAYLIAVLIVMVLVSIFTGAVLTAVYVSLRQSGQMSWAVPISLSVSAVSAVVLFLIFIAIRGAMPAAASPDGPIEAYDDGGTSMGFGRAIATCFRKYAVFSGRASRSEYWFFVLFQILLLIGLMIVDLAAFRGQMNVLSTVGWLILLLPGLAVSVRRLHDVDMSGWFVLIGFVPLIGAILMLVWMCQRGSDGANRFGMGPAPATIPEVFA
jgi:uncharacterized membrane protein YhaH (DUF805 family)